MSGRKGVPSIDLLPEAFPYRDNGCEVSPSCLSCPLPKCKYDDPGWLIRARRAKRDQDVLTAHRCQESTTVELTRRFHVSQRTIHRILARSDTHSRGAP